MNKIYLFAIAFVMAASLVLAAVETPGIHEPGTGLVDPELKESTQGTGAGLESNVATATSNQGSENQLQIQTSLQSGSYQNQNGEQMQIQTQAGEMTRLQVGNVEARSSMNMTQEQVQNRTKLMVKLSNGMNSEIKVMPDAASAKALEVLGAKCEERNCSIELKEVKQGNQTKAAYEIKTQKQAKILGLFQAKLQVQAQVDAENGEVIQSKKAWWAFLASETA